MAFGLGGQSKSGEKITSVLWFHVSRAFESFSVLSGDSFSIMSTFAEPESCAAFNESPIPWPLQSRSKLLN
jgi:hypothetical protein